jgi:hypothetical protein
MAHLIDRRHYADIYGPTTGDRVRLGDTGLVLEVESDATTYGDECKFGGGKVLRDGMGQAAGISDARALDCVITNALIVDWTGIRKADVGIKSGRIAAIGKAGNPDVMAGVTEGMIVGATTEAIAGEGLILTAGGIPLLYLGDEIGTLNDYTYRDDPAKERDSRWVHRPRVDWNTYAKRNDPKSMEGRVYQGLQKLIAIRKENTAFSGGELEIIPVENDQVIGFVRRHHGKHAAIFANFSEHEQIIPGWLFDQFNLRGKKQVAGISNVEPGKGLAIAPLDFIVLL